MRVREELDRSEVELNRLLQDKMGRRTSIVKVRGRVLREGGCPETVK